MDAEFARLCGLEPRLAELLAEAAAVEAEAAGFCANEIWIHRFKPRLVRLAGWCGENPHLRTCEAYDIAYDAVYRALPDCRKCGCLADEAAALEAASR